MISWPKQQLCEVADGIVAIVHGQGEVGVSNASFLLEGNRALVVDTMTFPEMATGMMREIAHRGAHVSAVLHTHHHLDHIGGDQLFTGVPIVSHHESIQTLQQLGLPTQLCDRVMPQFRGHFDTLALSMPEPLLDQVILPGDGELRVFTSAHTVADVTVWFPSSRVLIAGDLSFIGVTPFAGDGLVSGWIAALDALIALQPEVVVPGHGPIGTVQDLLVLRDYFLAIHHTGREAVEQHLSTQDALALLDLGPVAEWIESKRNLINLERAMQEACGEIHQGALSAMPPSMQQP